MTPVDNEKGKLHLVERPKKKASKSIPINVTSPVVEILDRVKREADDIDEVMVVYRMKDGLLAWDTSCSLPNTLMLFESYRHLVLQNRLGKSTVK